MSSLFLAENGGGLKEIMVGFHYGAVKIVFCKLVINTHTPLINASSIKC
jgi:hypothetical protein